MMSRPDSLPPGGQDAFSRVQRKLFDQWKTALQFLVGGLVIGWVLVSSIGWIVRGFLGVPRGKDAPPNT